MDTKEVRKLLDIISTVVNEEGSYFEKHDAILAECSDNEKTNLHEFASWFDVVS